MWTRPQGRATHDPRVRQLHDEVKSCGSQPADNRVIHRRSMPFRSGFLSRDGPLSAGAVDRSIHNRRQYICEFDKTEYGTQKCQSMPGETVDAAVADFVIDAVNQRNIAVTLAVQEQVATDFAKADRHRVQQIERLNHAADSTRQRYFFVEPGNRLVATTLEREWNSALLAVEQAEADRERQSEAFERLMTDEQTRRIEELAWDFATAWESPAHDNADRKRMLALLVEDVTLTRVDRSVSVQLRMRGGKTVELDPVALAGPGTWRAGHRRKPWPRSPDSPRTWATGTSRKP